MTVDIPSLDGWTAELRSGVLPLAVLGQLKEPQYSASLFQALEQRGLVSDPGTLTPLLRRLEKQKLLIGNWDETGVRPRKYYALSDAGKEAFEKMNSDWQSVAHELQQIVKGDGNRGVD